MQCDVQLTTQVWWLQTHSIYVHKPTQMHCGKRPIMISKQFPESKGSILVLHLFTTVAHWNELLLVSAWTSLFVLTHEHTSSRASQCTHSQQCCVEPCRQFPLLRYWAAFSHPVIKGFVLSLWFWNYFLKTVFIEKLSFKRPSKPFCFLTTLSHKV